MKFSRFLSRFTFLSQLNLYRRVYIVLIMFGSALALVSLVLHYIHELIVPRKYWLRIFGFAVVIAGVGFGVLFYILICIRRFFRSFRGKCMNKIPLNGRTCIVTGANCGIGKAVVKEFARRQARVILACRDVQKGSYAAAEIKRELGESVDLRVMELDLASLDSVRQFSSRMKESEGHIDILVNNAGVHQCSFMRSKDGFEMHFAVNHLGHFLLTNLLLEHIEASDDGRIIIVSCSTHVVGRMDLTNFDAGKKCNPLAGYIRSKLANILFSLELGNRVRPGVTVCSILPGVARTELCRHLLENFAIKVLWHICLFIFYRSAEEAAETIIYAATDPDLKGTTGKCLGECREWGLPDHVKDAEVAYELWEVSERLTGLANENVDSE